MKSNSPYTNAYKARHPEKRAAQRAVSDAVRAGTLIQQPCSKCNATPADAHHEDYSKPLDIIWLCRSCHAKTHVAAKQIPAREGAAAKHPEAVRLKSEGYTYAQIAEKLHTTKGTIYKWLNAVPYK